MKKYLTMAAVLVAASLVLAGGSLASSQHSLFGQCGGTVWNGSQLYMAWANMDVTSQAAAVETSAGFQRMDNSLPTWMDQRVVRAMLARSASPEDFGCHPGQLFSVGPRLIPKGTPVMVALPARFSKSDISVVPRKGFGRQMFAVHAVGKSNCSNPLRGVVFVWLYVKAKPVKTVPHKPKPKVHKPTKSTPPASCTITNSPGAACGNSGPCAGVGNCNTIWVTCSTLVNGAIIQWSQSFSSEQEADNWAQQNCTSPPTIQTCTSNCQKPQPKCTSNCLPVPPCSVSPQPKWCGKPGPSPSSQTPGQNPSDGQPNPDGSPPASGTGDPGGNPPSDNGGTQCPPGYNPDGNGGCIPSS